MREEFEAVVHTVRGEMVHGFGGSPHALSVDFAAEGRGRAVSMENITTPDAPRVGERLRVTVETIKEGA